jgi:hypothetical protein
MLDDLARSNYDSADPYVACLIRSATSRGVIASAPRSLNSNPPLTGRAHRLATPPRLSPIDQRNSAVRGISPACVSGGSRIPLGGPDS